MPFTIIDSGSEKRQITKCSVFLCKCTQHFAITYHAHVLIVMYMLVALMTPQPFPRLQSSAFDCDVFHCGDPSCRDVTGQ
jgi:hypothetical protein